MSTPTEGMPIEPMPGFDYLSDQVTQWKLQHGGHIDETYLASIPYPAGSGATISVVTAETFRSVFGILHDESAATVSTATNIHKRLMRLVDTLHEQRAYLQSGAIYMGARPRAPGYWWNQRYWGLTPEALHGLSFEDDRVNHQRIGERSRARIQMLLGHIAGIDADAETIRLSGWTT